MTLKKKIFDQIVGKIKMSSYFSNYFTFCWHFAETLICSPGFENDEHFEISKFDTQNKIPLLIDTTEEEE